MIKVFILPILMLAALSSCAGDAGQDGGTIKTDNLVFEKDVYDLEYENNTYCPPEHAAKGWC